MYATYKIDVNEICRQDYTNDERFLKLQKSDQDLFKSTFQSLACMEEILKAEDILKNWFPLLNKQVFISHSHQDEDEALKLAAWLYHNFDIECFIDSQVWGYSADLQRKLDNEYCINHGEATYSYSKRNISTAHVHMLLSTALQNMIDNCECIIFIESDNSAKPLAAIKRGKATYSPWIYAEILSTRILRRRSPDAHPGRPKPAFESMAKDSASKVLTIEYPLNLNHLYSLNRSILRCWKDKFNSLNHYNHSNQYEALDKLYEMTNIPTIKTHIL